MLILLNKIRKSKKLPQEYIEVNSYCKKYIPVVVQNLAFLAAQLGIPNYETRPVYINGRELLIHKVSMLIKMVQK